MKFPIQIQADNAEAEDSLVPATCHVFDMGGFTTVFNALCAQYLHVVAWDADGNKVSEYDNRG